MEGQEFIGKGGFFKPVMVVPGRVGSIFKPDAIPLSSRRIWWIGYMGIHVESCNTQEECLDDKRSAGKT